MIYAHEAREAREPAKAPVRAALPPCARDLLQAQHRYLSRRDLDPWTAQYNGWYPSRAAGDLEERIVIPASPAALRFWQARAMDPGVRKRYQSPHGARGCAAIVVYPLQVMSRTVALVEGPMDALAAAGAGYLGVALMGNTPSAEVFDYVATVTAGREALAVPDRDSQGEGARWLAELTAREIRARLVLLPSGAKDLAGIPAQDRREVLR